MDLNSISQQIQYLPDAQLAAAVKNPNGVMPQYLALAELSRRQKIRASAPQQQPQGTVADDVLHSLRSAGIQPQQPMQQGAPMPQQMGIAQAQPQQQAPGMARGGIVRFDTGTGGQTVGGAATSQSPLASLVTGGGSIPDVSYNYQETPMQDYASGVRSLYGPGQDYSEEMNGIRQLRSNLHQPNDQDLSRLQGLYTMASKDPMGGLAQASLDAHTAYDKQQQDYFHNALGTYDKTYAIKSGMEKRQDDIAGAIKDVWAIDNRLKEAQASGSLTAQKTIAELTEAKYKRAQDLLTVDKDKRNSVIGHMTELVNNPNTSPEIKAGAMPILEGMQLANKIEAEQERVKQEQKEAGENSRNAATNATRLQAARITKEGQLDGMNNLTSLLAPDSGATLEAAPGYNKEFLDKLLQQNPAVARKVKAIAEYREPPVNVGSGRGFEFQNNIMNLVQKYSGDTYDSKKFGVRNKMITRMEAGDISQSETNMNTAIGHLEEMLPQIEAVNNHHVAPEANRLGNAISRRIDVDLATSLNNLEQTKNAVASELKNAYQGKAESEVEAWKSGFDLNAHKDVQKGAALNAVKLLAKRIEGIRNEYKIAFDGSEYNKQLLSDHSHEVLDKLGIDVDALEKGNFRMKDKKSDGAAPGKKSDTATPNGKPHLVYDPVSGTLQPKSN